MWESTPEQESSMKIDFSPAAPLPHYLGIFRNSTIPVEYYRELFSDDVASVHSQNSWNVNFTSEHREEKKYFPDPSNQSSDLS